MTAYCAAVLPHSEISGSTLICSSPKLIAACHVLHRLLMPRHSPCALSSLTCVEENCVPFRPSPGGAEHPLHSVSFSFFAPDPLALGSVARNEETSLSSLWFSIKNYAGSTELLKQNCKLPLKKVPQLKFLDAIFRSRPLLPCFYSFFLCSVFKVQLRGVPSKLNNVRLKRSDLEVTRDLRSREVSLERR